MYNDRTGKENNDVHFNARTKIAFVRVHSLHYGAADDRLPRRSSVTILSSNMYIYARYMTFSSDAPQHDSPYNYAQTIQYMD